MQNPKINPFIINHWLKKTIFMVGCAGIFTIITLPISSQEYTLIDLFHPYDDLTESEYDNYKAENNNLIDKLKSTNNFKNLVSEIEEVGLTETLKNDYFILFAPNDDAFQALLQDNIFEKYSQPVTRLAVLKYHLIPTKFIPEKEILENRGKVKVKTDEGNEITVYILDDELKVNNDNTKVHEFIGANNGAIYEIDQVLLPPNF